MRPGDMYARVKWMTQDGEVFSARPYTVLRCGHWHHISYREYAWEFDRLSRKDRVFAGIWRDSHDPDEQMRYWFDGNFEAGCARKDAESADGTESVEGKS